MASDLDKSDEVHGEKAIVEQSETLVKSDLINDALDGENREHDMSTWEAMKSHPWACLWAFTMCFTIVSFLCCFLLISPHFGFPQITPYLQISRSYQLIYPQSGYGVVRYVPEW